MTPSSDDRAALPPAAPGPPAVGWPFDRILIARDGATREMTPEQFFALPLAERIEVVVQRRASFWAGSAEVDAKEALARIRAARARAH
ncbi:MAG: hypothetical protein IPG50_28085 [Myxococcales bacterium]|nr:hypothetical protein [Myxococcales bacterium]